MLKEIAKFVVGAGLIGMLTVAGAKAQSPELPGPIDSFEDLQSTGKMLFKLADTNNDNLISQKEAVDAGNLIAGGFFFRADANGDGTLTRDEVQTAREALFNQKPVLRIIFQRGKAEIDRQAKDPASANQANVAKQTVSNLIDPNHDGNLSAPEVRQAVQTSVQSLFLMSDRNGDGQISPDEVNQAVVEVGRQAVQTAFNAADTDNNGAISEAEFDKALLGPAHLIFGIVDANKDKQLSVAEIQSSTATVMRELKAMRVPDAETTIVEHLQRQGNAAANAPRAVTPVPATARPVVPATPVQPR
jgi:Ca2+-binding EF-hand superfamily protein